MTPAEIVPLDGTEPAGWLRPVYEAAYDLATTRSADGSPPVSTGHLRHATSVTAALGAGTFVRFTRYPGRPSEPNEVLDEPSPVRLFEVRDGQARYTAVARRSPYAPLHGLLVAQRRRQEASERPLAVALALMRALGPGYTGTFNVGGRTHEGFHAQFFRESAPLWDFVGSGAVRLGAAASRGTDTEARAVAGWPCASLLITGADAVHVACAVTNEAARVGRLGGTFDITYRWAAGRFRVLFFPRRRDPSDRRGTLGLAAPHLGTMGALECGGWVLSVRDANMFDRITRDSDAMAATYREALSAVTFRPGGAADGGMASRHDDAVAVTA